MRTYTYEINEHQKAIHDVISKLPTDSLYYVVVQQNIIGANFALNELKKHIRRSVEEYKRRYNANAAIKYIAIFETTHDFFMSQHTSKVVSTDFYSGFHFHLFISGVDERYIKELTYWLNSQKNKSGCISKIDWAKKKKLDNDFILYHVKQMMFRYSPQLVLRN